MKNVIAYSNLNIFYYTINFSQEVVFHFHCFVHQNLVAAFNLIANVDVEREKEEAKPVIAPRPKAAPAPAAASAPAAGDANGTKAVAPLPGTIMQIFVNVGDEVKRGDKILMYEAMKMENNFLAEVDGVIKDIKVKVGDNVLQGAVLAIIG